MKPPRLFVFCLLVAVLAIFNAAWLGAQTTDLADLEVESWIEENVPLYMERARMPGFSIAVVRDGETIYAEGFGLRDTQKDLPATPDTLYGIGRRGLLYLEVTSQRTERKTYTPLIPEVPTLASMDFYTSRNGLKSPVEFAVGEDGSVDLFIGRYCYHKVD